MTVTIKIIYRSAASGSLILQRGSFSLRGRKPEKVAYDWWQQLQRGMFVESLEQVLCNGEDITEMVRDFQ